MHLMCRCSSFIQKKALFKSFGMRNNFAEHLVTSILHSALIVLFFFLKSELFGECEKCFLAGMDEETLNDTLSKCNRSAKGEIQDSFGKHHFPVTFDPSARLYTFIVTPSLHYCMGGVAINTKAQVRTPLPSHILTEPKLNSPR
jgi:hypothetical protein